MFHLNYRQQSIIAISDTHGRHRELRIPEADVLIHCGDACTDGDMNQLEDFFNWFSMQPARHKLFVAGNHDLPFDLDPDEAASLVPANVMYLEDRWKVIEGIVFFSAPARPWLHEMPHSSPEKIDFLLTHGPAYSILDKGLGCTELLSFVQQNKPAYHLFGHIHETTQQQATDNHTCAINICVDHS